MADSEAVIQARRALGSQLAAIRHAAGYTQHDFAPLTGYSRSTLANAETGRQGVVRDFWERCDKALDTGGSLALGFDQIQAATRQEKEHQARQAQAEREARVRAIRSENVVSDPILSPSAPLTAWPANPAVLARGAAVLWSTDAPDPASVGVDVGSAALRWLIAPDDPPLARAQAWPQITLGDIHRVKGVRQRLKDLDNAHGGGSALPLTAAYLRHEVTPMLRGRYDEPTGQALMSAIAELVLDAGWMAYDIHRHPVARRHLTHALRFAHAGRQRLLGARILSALCHQALHVGQVSLALDFIEAARNGARQPIPPRVVAMLAAMAACAWAAAHDPARCEQALGEAEAALATVSPDDDEPAWLDFDAGGLWGHAARAYRDLGRLGPAAELAERAMRSCKPGHGRTHVQRTAILAMAAVQAGEIDRAALLGETIVTEAWGLHSNHVYGDIAALLAAVKPSKSTCIVAFVDSATEILAARVPLSPS